MNQNRGLEFIKLVPWAFVSEPRAVATGSTHALD